MCVFFITEFSSSVYLIVVLVLKKKKNLKSKLFTIRAAFQIFERASTDFRERLGHISFERDDVGCICAGV